MGESSSLLSLILLLAACVRILLDIFQVDLGRLPLTAAFGMRGTKIHRWGLIFAWGYLILFAPAYLAS